MLRAAYRGRTAAIAARCHLLRRSLAGHRWYDRALSSSISSSSPPPPPRNDHNRSRLGVGGSKLALSDPASYATVIRTALEQGVTTFESGHGGEGRLAEAYENATREPLPPLPPQNDDGGDKNAKGAVTLTARFGYRTRAFDPDRAAREGACEGGLDDAEERRTFPNDVFVETADAKAAAEYAAEEATKKKEEEAEEGGGEKANGAAGAEGGGSVDGPDPGRMVAVHNLSAEYALHKLSTSPLAKLRRRIKDRGSSGGGGTGPDVNLIYMAHNPEAQCASALHAATLSGREHPPVDELRDMVRQRLTEAFVGLEQGVAEDLIDSYGVCSNGLSLPSSHPMHLRWMDVLEAAGDAVQKCHGDDDTAVELTNEVTGTRDRPGEGGLTAKLSTIQLPANLMETRGLKVARSIREYLDSDDGDDGDESPPKLPYLPRTVDVFVTRPLTAYPDGGTGAAGVGGHGKHPLKLVDYLIDTAPSSPPPDADGAATADQSSSDDPQFVSSDFYPTKQWTHHLLHHQTPPGYQSVLNAAMSHFDATSLLELQSERKLTAEERETLDGCRLLQSILHDLDANLSDPAKTTSFAAYEDELYTKVIPVMHDTFEELDEGSAEVLRSFFASHGGAVRHAAARNVRNLLRDGGALGEGMVVPKYGEELDEGTSLQEFALRTLLRGADEDGRDGVSRVIVGCPRAEHLMEAVRAADGA